MYATSIILFCIKNKNLTPVWDPEESLYDSSIFLFEAKIRFFFFYSNSIVTSCLELSRFSTKFFSV